MGVRTDTHSTYAPARTRGGRGLRCDLLEHELTSRKGDQAACGELRRLPTGSTASDLVGFCRGAVEPVLGFARYSGIHRTGYSNPAPIPMVEPSVSTNSPEPSRPD